MGKTERFDRNEYDGYDGVQRFKKHKKSLGNSRKTRQGKNETSIAFKKKNIRNTDFDEKDD